MDDRVAAHARILVEHSIDARPDDEVVVMAGPDTEPLVRAVYGLLGEIGANVVHVRSDRAALREYLRSHDTDGFETPDALVALVEAADALVNIRGTRNTHETSDVDPETMSAFGRARKPVSDGYQGKRFVITQHPTPANAQDAEMPTAAYEEFVWDAVDRDWEAQREFQSRIVERLESAQTVRVVSGADTDVSMDVSGMRVVNDDGRKNMPGGEVFTAPNPATVEGTVLFDYPVLVQGREVSDARVVFEDGTIVEHAAETNEEALTGVLHTDEGASRLGELGIGTNRRIDRFTKNMLFDEKMGGTVHLAVGRAIEETVPDDREGNDSAVHLDMLVDTTEDARIEFDGETVQRNGRFWFEDGFEE
ncbi:MAG: aminopeptidase [Halanaeroarchaeum sp.]